MIFTFAQERKKQQKIAILFVLLVLVIALIIGFNSLKKPAEAPLLPEISPLQKIEINFEVLKSPFLEQLQNFEEIAPFEEEPGRENPFLSY